MLEGVDKAGKTTQCKKLVHALQRSGQPAEMMRFPGGLFHVMCDGFGPLHDCIVNETFRYCNMITTSCGSFWGADRTTTIGQLISAYLENKSDLEDHTVHLLFSANRWEMV